MNKRGSHHVPVLTVFSRALLGWILRTVPVHVYRREMGVTKRSADLRTAPVFLNAPPLIKISLWWVIVGNKRVLIYGTLCLYIFEEFLVTLRQSLTCLATHYAQPLFVRKDGDLLGIFLCVAQACRLTKHWGIVVYNDTVIKNNFFTTSQVLIWILNFMNGVYFFYCPFIRTGHPKTIFQTIFFFYRASNDSHC